MPVDPTAAQKMIQGIKTEGMPPRRLMNILVELQAKFLSTLHFKPAFTVKATIGDPAKWTVDVAAAKMGRRVFADVAALELQIPIRTFEGVVKNVAKLELVDTPKGMLMTIVMTQASLQA
jgi:hypothetical protein